ncbi:hypothetical protein IP88_02775 [alpha proteobacterium AAP81b]|nr:hypothetical protein IP88_02775 [alpha proteobacterium AAP81b]
MTIVLDPEDKALIETRARANSLSTGEYVRRASQSYDAGVDEATLAALVGQFAETVAAMRTTLSEATLYAQARLDEIAVLREGRGGDRR